MFFSCALLQRTHRYRLRHSLDRASDIRTASNSIEQFDLHLLVTLVHQRFQHDCMHARFFFGHEQVGSIVQKNSDGDAHPCLRSRLVLLACRPDRCRACVPVFRALPVGLISSMRVQLLFGGRNFRGRDHYSSRGLHSGDCTLVIVSSGLPWRSDLSMRPETKG